MPLLHIPPSAFGGTVPSADEIRFYRLIDERTTDGQERETLVLACGHTHTTEPLPAEQEYAYCPACAEARLTRAAAG